MFSTVLKIFIIFLMLLIISSCQRALVKKQQSTADVDSTLFFEQSEIHDPFLDQLAANPSQSFLLKKTIIPPPKPEPEKSKFKSVEGYRVQIFAGVDSLNALSTMSTAGGIVSDTIYIFREKGLFKLQVGDYLYYPQADSIKRRLRQTSFAGAWIVKTGILIPNVETVQDSSIDENRIAEQGKYKIQVIAITDADKAQSLVDELKVQYNNKSFFEQNGNIYKVFVGYFNQEEEARRVLELIRKGNYPDAWLVY